MGQGAGAVKGIGNIRYKLQEAALRAAVLGLIPILNRISHDFI
jgi:hypothetical protein